LWKEIRQPRFRFLAFANIRGQKQFLTIYRRQQRMFRDGKTHTATRKSQPAANAFYCVCPEKLSEYWRNKLESELRSRKYSRRTKNVYIYFNCLFCRVVQKTPEDIQGGDLTKFLAVIEKDKEYSASSMNLAISAVKFFYSNVLKNKSVSGQHRPHHGKRIPPVLAYSNKFEHQI
jgi:hypothetical protein